jgi:hypothetical protein
LALALGYKKTSMAGYIDHFERVFLKNLHSSIRTQFRDEKERKNTTDEICDSSHLLTIRPLDFLGSAAASGDW